MTYYLKMKRCKYIYFLKVIIKILKQSYNDGYYEYYVSITYKRKVYEMKIMRMRYECF